MDERKKKEKSLEKYFRPNLHFSGGDSFITNFMEFYKKAPKWVRKEMVVDRTKFFGQIRGPVILSTVVHWLSLFDGGDFL